MVIYMSMFISLVIVNVIVTLSFCLPHFNEIYAISFVRGLNSTGDGLMKILVLKIFAISSKRTEKYHIDEYLYFA